MFGERGLAWMAVGMVLMVLELVLPGAFLLWLGLAAVGTGLAIRAAMLTFDLQVVVFAGLSVVSIGAALLLRRRARPTTVNAPGSGLIGRSATALAFDGAEGRVRLGDSDWPARMRAGRAPEPQAALRVVAVDGMVLLVEPAEMNQSQMTQA